MLNRDRLEKYNQRTALQQVVPLPVPYVVFIDPSGACNFKCKFCPCNRSDFMTTERHKMLEMRLFYKIVDDLIVLGGGGQIKVINLYGFGEPFLNKNIIDMVRYIKQKNVCRELRITTNGYLLNPDLNRELIEAKVDMIRISVEALTAEDYQDICDVKIDFDAFCSNIADLYKISRNTDTKVSVKTLNVALPDEKAANYFYDTFESISDYTYIQDTTQAWAEFEAFVPKGNYEAGNIGDMMDNDKICSFSLTTMTIHSNGSVGVCPQDWKFATQYGNVKDDSLLNLWNSKKLANIQKAHLNGKRCNMSYCKDCDVCVSNDDVRKVADEIIERIDKKQKEQEKR